MIAVPKRELWMSRCLTTDGSAGNGSSRQPRILGGSTLAWWQKCAQRGAEDVASTYNWLDRAPEGTKAWWPGFMAAT